MTPETQPNTSDVPDRVECRATTEPFVRMMSVAAMLVGVGIWCMVDQRPFTKFADDESKFMGWAFNYYGQFLFTVVGLAMMAWTFVWFRGRLVADAEGIGYAGKPQIAWGKITRVDARLLRSKGYLYLYHDGKRMALDAWKLRDFRDLVLLIEKYVPADCVQR